MKLIDIHTHGGYGISFNSANASQIKDFAKKMLKRGIVAFCPTLATDTLENINKALWEIGLAVKSQGKDEAKILGAHLEALFLNPLKKGIHQKELLLEPSVENFEKLENREVVKIVTLAMELDKDLRLTKYLKSKGIKVQLGHSTASGVLEADATTHHFNAMGQIHHREPSLTLEALVRDDIYCEIIADTIHTSTDILKLFFKVKPHNKILLVSDSLAVAHGEREMMFCNKTIYPNGKDKDGNLGGGVMFLDEIVKQLDSLKILPKKEAEKMALDNVVDYLELDTSGWAL